MQHSSARTMTGVKHAPISCLLCMLWILGGVQGQRDCTACFQMNIGTIVGLIIGDIIVTVLIALAVYLLATTISNKAKKEANGDTSSSAAEPTYQELQGQKMDIYSDLSHK